MLLDGSFGASSIITGARQGALLHNSANTLTEWYDKRYTGNNGEGATMGCPQVNVTGPRHWNVDYFVVDADFLRIKDITLGYNLPQKACDKIGLDNLRFTFGVQNAYTFTDYPLYNPQANTKGGNAGTAQFGVDNGSYPLARVYTLGINLNF